MGREKVLPGVGKEWVGWPVRSVCKSGACLGYVLWQPAGIQSVACRRQRHTGARTKPTGMAVTT